ncbi:MAG: hypothetical protein WCR30_03510 [Clostridia bacterium]
MISETMAYLNSLENFSKSCSSKPIKLSEQLLNEVQEAVIYFTENVSLIDLDSCQKVAFACKKIIDKNNINKVNAVIEFVETIIIEKSGENSNIDTDGFYQILNDRQNFDRFTKFSVAKNLKEKLAMLSEDKILSLRFTLDSEIFQAIVANMPFCSSDFFFKIISENNNVIDENTKIAISRALANKIVGLNKSEILSKLQNHKNLGKDQNKYFIYCANLTEQEALNIYYNKSASPSIRYSILANNSVSKDKRIAILVKEWNDIKFGFVPKTSEINHLILNTLFLFSDLYDAPTPKFNIDYVNTPSMNGAWHDFRCKFTKSLSKELSTDGIMYFFPRQIFIDEKDFGVSMLETVLHEYRHMIQKHSLAYAEDENANSELISAIYLSEKFSVNSEAAYIAFKAPEFSKMFAQLQKKYKDETFFQKIDCSSYFGSQNDFEIFMRMFKAFCKSDPKKLNSIMEIAEKFASAVLLHDNRKEIEEIQKSLRSPYHIYSNSLNEFDSRNFTLAQLKKFSRIAEFYDVDTKKINQVISMSEEHEAVQASGSENLRNLLVKVALNMPSIEEEKFEEADFLKYSALRYVQKQEKNLKYHFCKKGESDYEC